MNQTIEERIQSIEDQLKEIRKELEESLARYKQSQYPFTNGDISKFRSRSIGNIPEYDVTVYYQKGTVVKWPDGIEMKSKCNTICNDGDWYDPTRYNEYGNIIL